MAFSRLEEGYENAMKEYYKKQVSQLNTLITMLIGQLTPGDRQKVMTICTIDVHARDVVDKIIQQKVPSFLQISADECIREVQYCLIIKASVCSCVIWSHSLVALEDDMIG